MSVMISLPATIQTALQMVFKLPVPAFLLCGDDLQFYYNPSFYEHLEPREMHSFLSGVPVGEVYPKSLDLLLPIIREIRETGEGVRSGQGIFPLCRNWDGEPTTWTYCFEALTDDGGHIEGIFVSCLQQALPAVMARRIERELELTRSEMEGQRRMYEAIAASTPDLIYVFNLNYKFIYANKALLAMWGRTWEDSIGQGLLALGYEPWHAEMHEREIDTVVATKKAIRGEVSFPHAVLGRRIYDYIFAPVLDEKGDVVAIAGTTRDISELKAAEEALRRSEERLEQVVHERTSELQRSNEDLLQFAHVASHDLKEPTRKVRFFADRLINDPATKLSPLGRSSVGKIISASNRMFSMIEGVLNYSKANNLQEAYRMVDLAEVIGQIISDLEVVIQQKEARVESSGLPVVYGAPMLLYQLFYNLINNSLKFSRQGVPARVFIAARELDGGPDGRSWVEITVRDNGIGFPQLYAEKIFTTFTRLHPKDHYEGTGLGLSLCKKIVERHRGTIEASSRVGEGSIFRIVIPSEG
jgi:PAS domain S-box-containing protein